MRRIRNLITGEILAIVLALGLMATVMSLMGGF